MTNIRLKNLFNFNYMFSIVCSEEAQLFASHFHHIQKYWSKYQAYWIKEITKSPNPQISEMPLLRSNKNEHKVFHFPRHKLQNQLLELLLYFPFGCFISMLSLNHERVFLWFLHSSMWLTTNGKLKPKSKIFC